MATFDVAGGRISRSVQECTTSPLCTYGITTPHTSSFNRSILTQSGSCVSGTSHEFAPANLLAGGN